MIMFPGRIGAVAEREEASHQAATCIARPGVEVPARRRPLQRHRRRRRGHVADAVDGALELRDRHRRALDLGLYLASTRFPR